MSAHLVGQNIDTFIGNARLKGDFPEALADQLEDLKRRSQEAEEDLPTPWQFAGEVLFIKPHGAGRQWRWILHSPSIHVDVGLGRLTHIVAKARLSSAFLWEHEIGTALTLLYGFLAELPPDPVHPPGQRGSPLCVTWQAGSSSLDDMSAFITRSRSKGLRLGTDAADEELDASLKPEDPSLRLERCDCNSRAVGWPRSTSARALLMPAASTTRRRRSPCRAKTGCRKSGRATAGMASSSVTRVEFRYKRECLREMKVEEAYAFLDQIPGLWAYSTKQWLRHTIPNGDPNRARWPISPRWQLLQQASFFCDGILAVRERRRAGDLTLLCQTIAGCSTSAAAFLHTCFQLKMTERISSFGFGTGSNATSKRRDSISTRFARRKPHASALALQPNDRMNSVAQRFW